MSEERIITWLQGVLAGSNPPLPGASSELYDDILQTAEQNGITSLIYYLLNTDDKWADYPGDLRDRFSARTRQLIATSLLWKQEILDVHTRLHDANIRALFIKGIALSYNLYQAPYLRPFCDVDVLCPDRETAEKAYKLIKPMGYERPNEISGKYIYHLLSCNKQSDSGFVFTLGFHWRVNNLNYFANAFSYEELEATSRPVPELSATFRTFSHENAMLLACLHRIAHIPDGKANRLIWLYDIHLLANIMTEPQWTAFAEISSRKNLAGVSMDGLRKCKESLNTNIPDNVIESLGNHASADPFHAVQNGSRWLFHFRNIQSLPGWKARFGLVKEYLFPSPKYMMKKYHSENMLLLPYFYIKRMYQGLIRFI